MCAAYRRREGHVEVAGKPKRDGEAAQASKPVGSNDDTASVHLSIVQRGGGSTSVSPLILVHTIPLKLSADFISIRFLGFSSFVAFFLPLCPLIQLPRLPQLPLGIRVSVHPC